MRPQKVLDTDIMTGLTQVFRTKGYEGASLKDLSEATGLKKASLYHRFPNGKQEMADAVLQHIGTWVEEHVFQALLDPDRSPELRLRQGLAEIRTLYKGGQVACIFRALSMEAGLHLFEEQVKNGMKEWIDTLTQVGLALGLSQEKAEKSALQTLIQIQGSLIVTKGLGDIGVFEDTLAAIEQHYLS